MHTVEQLTGKRARNCILATIQYGRNAISLHNFGDLRVSRPDSSGNFLILLAAALFWTGFHEIQAGVNPTVYTYDAFEAIQTKQGTRFMAFRQAMMRPGMKMIFSAFEAAQFFVLESEKDIREHLPTLFLQVGIPKEESPALVENAIQRILIH